MLNLGVKIRFVEIRVKYTRIKNVQYASGHHGNRKPPKQNESGQSRRKKYACAFSYGLDRSSSCVFGHISIQAPGPSVHKIQTTKATFGTVIVAAVRAVNS